MPTPSLSVSKDEFILKLYFIDSKSDPQSLSMLKEQFVLHANKYHHLLKQMETKFDEGWDNKAYGHFLILQHAIEREKSYKNWLESIIQDIQLNRVSII